MSKEDQITVCIKGGLGNQLFCYAAARSLSLKHQRKLLLDNQTGFRNDYYQRSFRLGFLSLPNEVILLNDASFYPSKIWRRISKFIPLRFRYYLRDKYLSPQELLKAQTLKSQVYMDGYWQSEDYFATIKPILINEFQMAQPLPVLASGLRQQILESNSVMVHIRRKEYSHLLNEGYYAQAIEVMKQQVKDPVFFVFSDDFSWAKQSGIFKNQEPIWMDSLQGLDELIDFELMKSCRHAIVANSSFSWWAAWLIEHPQKFVVCPSQTGFALEMPSDWKRIPVELP